MVDVDTFLTALYVMVDDFCYSHRPKGQPGPEPSLSESEVVTLAIFASGLGLAARGTSTATPQAISARHSLPCLIALSSTAACDLAQSS